MGPKKKTKVDTNQQTLSHFIKDSESGKCTPASESETVKNTQANNDPTQSSKSKVRKYNQEWQKLYSWISYDEATQSMYCTLCTNAKMCNGMVKNAQCTNFRQSTLARHALLGAHQMLVQAPVLQQTVVQLQLCTVQMEKCKGQKTL